MYCMRHIEKPWHIQNPAYHRKFRHIQDSGINALFNHLQSYCAIFNPVYLLHIQNPAIFRILACPEVFFETAVRKYLRKLAEDYRREVLC